jgi:hypothetical protein
LYVKGNVVGSWCWSSVGCPVAWRAQQDRPNIVLILMDNLGYGELRSMVAASCAALTPRIDKLASEGMRLLNFNVEAQCTPSRSALMTGRFSIRSGTYEVPRGGAADGLTQWEITIAELLSARGYATGTWGKWHLGSIEERLPTHQGFDEWYGIPRSYLGAMWPSSNQTNGMWPSVGFKQGWNPNLVPPSPSMKRARANSQEDWELTGASAEHEPITTSRSVHRTKREGARHVLCVNRVLVGSQPSANRSLPARPATAIGPIASPRWTIAPARSWMPSRTRASKTTRWSSCQRQRPGRTLAGR